MGMNDANDELKVKTFSSHTSDVLNFRFERGGHATGWAIWMIDERSGCVFVQSDWGDTSYRWNTGAIGAPTMKDFLCTAEPSYLVRKMMGDGQRGPYADRYDKDLTLEHLTEILSESVAEYNFDVGGDYKSKREELADFCREIDDKSRDGGWVWYMAPDWLKDELMEGYDSLRYRPHGWREVHEDHLVPLLQAKLREMGYGTVERTRGANEKEWARLREIEWTRAHLHIGERVQR